MSATPPFLQPGSNHGHSTPSTKCLKSKPTSQNQLLVPIERDTSSKSRNDSEFSRDLYDGSHLLNPAELQLIITAICSIGPELEVFSGVSENEYDYILSNIADSSSRVVRKPSYIPRLKQLVITLPTDLHECIPEALHGMLRPIVSPIIPQELDAIITIHMNSFIDSPDDDSDTDGDTSTLGVPDMLIRVQASDSAPAPMWAFECSHSQSNEAALTKFKRFAQKSSNLKALTLIDIVESTQYCPPKEFWAIDNGLDSGTVLGFKEWSDRVRLVGDSSKVFILSHTWMHPLKATITTWIRSPDNILNIDNHDPSCYASEVLFPQLAGSNTSLPENQALFQHALGAIRDKVVEHLEEKYVGTDTLAESIQSVRDWSPPAAPIDWDKCVKRLTHAALWTSYIRYRTWHRKFFKNIGDEDSSGGRAGRSA